jgi:hypothetical protein
MVAIGVFDGLTICTCSLYHTVPGSAHQWVVGDDADSFFLAKRQHFVSRTNILVLG